MLDAHLDQFTGNIGAYKEEQGERFHLDVMDFECCYQGAAQREYDQRLYLGFNTSKSIQT